LDTAGITLDQVDAIAWSNNPYLAADRWIAISNPTIKKLAYSFTRTLNKSKNGIGKGLSLFDIALKPWQEEENEKAGFRIKFQTDIDKIPFYCIDHHLSHAASAYYSSGFDEATVITWDGSGTELKSKK
jgi:carbamoyltransferase